MDSVDKIIGDAIDKSMESPDSIDDIQTMLSDLSSARNHTRLVLLTDTSNVTQAITTSEQHQPDPFRRYWEVQTALDSRTIIDWWCRNMQEINQPMDDSPDSPRCSGISVEPIDGGFTLVEEFHGFRSKPGVRHS